MVLPEFSPNLPTSEIEKWAGGFREAGGGNRTRINSLEGCGFTTKLRPQFKSYHYSISFSELGLLLNNWKTQRRSSAGFSLW
jgi:hypothetical protein